MVLKVRLDPRSHARSAGGLASMVVRAMVASEHGRQPTLTSATMSISLAPAPAISTGITKHATAHNFVFSFATHLLEDE